MYEKNTKALMDMDWNYPEGFFEQFGQLETEEERIRLLYGKYKENLGQFEGIPLWEKGIPDQLENPGYQEEPGLYFYPCAGEAKGVVLVVPGGGYNCIAAEVEGYPMIRRLLEEGYSAALLIYRIRPYTQYESLQDIQRAIRILRYRQGELGIPGNRIFLMGGSAGGHLCTMASVHFDYGDREAADPVERESSRPDGAVISYGIFSMVSYPAADGLVKTNREKDPEETRLKSCYQDRDRQAALFFSPEKHVRPDMPPMFLWQTCDEDDPRKLFLFAKELADYGVRFEAHIFPYGGHGNGLWDGGSGTRQKDAHVAHWFGLAVEWMEDMMERADGLKAD